MVALKDKRDGRGSRLQELVHDETEVGVPADGAAVVVVQDVSADGLRDGHLQVHHPAEALKFGSGGGIFAGQRP